MHTATITQTDSTTFAGILGATTTILITTLDDCIWLVPYLSSTDYTADTTTAIANTKETWVRILHAIIFSATLIGLTSVTVIITYIFQQQLFLSNTGVFINDNSNSNSTYEVLVEAIGAVLCWILAGYYYYKSWQKRRRRRMLKETQQRQQEQEHIEENSNFVVTSTTETIPNSYYGSCNTDDESGKPLDPLTSIPQTLDGASNNSNDTSSFQPCTIITLTISGALDEVSYFPTLLLGHIFTGTELICGTICTVLIMLLIVTQLLSKCQSLLSCLDQIPLYGIITLYAILLTINLITETTISSP